MQIAGVNQFFTALPNGVSHLCLISAVIAIALPILARPVAAYNHLIAECSIEEICRSTIWGEMLCYLEEVCARCYIEEVCQIDFWGNHICHLEKTCHYL
jgi:hypothetical protein